MLTLIFPIFPNKWLTKIISFGIETVSSFKFLIYHHKNVLKSPVPKLVYIFIYLSKHSSTLICFHSKKIFPSQYLLKKLKNKQIKCE